MKYGYYASDTVVNPKAIKYNDVYKHDYKKSDSNDMVNHPKHYKAKNGLETIDVIDAFTENLKGYEATHTANILKYVCRWKEKNGVEDLKKARWYIDRLITKIEANEPVESHGIDAMFGHFNTDIYFENRSDAEDVFDRLIELATMYGFVSMADLKDLVSESEPMCVDYDLGWDAKTIRTSAWVYRVPNMKKHPYSYMIQLPAVADITNL